MSWVSSIPDELCCRLAGVDILRASAELEEAFGAFDGT